MDTFQRSMDAILEVVQQQNDNRNGDDNCDNSARGSQSNDEEFVEVCDDSARAHTPQAADGRTSEGMEGRSFAGIKYQHNEVNFFSGLNVGSEVSAKMKEKIWNHQYVEFAGLLSSHSADNEYAVIIGGNSNQPVLNLHPKPKKELMHSMYSLLYMSKSTETNYTNF